MTPAYKHDLPLPPHRLSPQSLVIDCRPSAGVPSHPECNREQDENTLDCRKSNRKNQQCYSYEECQRPLKFYSQIPNSIHLLTPYGYPLNIIIMCSPFIDLHLLLNLVLRNPQQLKSYVHRVNPTADCSQLQASLQSESCRARQSIVVAENINNVEVAKACTSILGPPEFLFCLIVNPEETRRRCEMLSSVEYFPPFIQEVWDFDNNVASILEYYKNVVQTNVKVFDVAKFSLHCLVTALRDLVIRMLPAGDSQPNSDKLLRDFYY